MTIQEKVASLIRETSELPEEAQAELVNSLVEMRLQHSSVYHLDDDEREALERSAEDVRLGRFASDKEMEDVFSQFSA